MKQVQRRTRPGGGTRQVHQIQIVQPNGSAMFEGQFVFDGPELGSIDGRVDEWTARECETR